MPIPVRSDTRDSTLRATLKGVVVKSQSTSRINSTDPDRDPGTRTGDLREAKYNGLSANVNQSSSSSSSIPRSTQVDLSLATDSLPTSHPYQHGDKAPVIDKRTRSQPMSRLEKPGLQFNRPTTKTRDTSSIVATKRAILSSNHAETATIVSNSDKFFRSKSAEHQQAYHPKKQSYPLLQNNVDLFATAHNHGNAHAGSFSTLQGELLQLHLVHVPAAGNLVKLESKIKDQLRDQFRHIQSQNIETTTIEQARQVDRNLAALAAWLPPTYPELSSKRLQDLSEIVQYVQDLRRPEGLFHRLVNEFSEWQAQLQLATQWRSSGEFDREPVFAMPVHSQWLEKTSALATDLDLCAETLSQMGEFDQHSALQVLLNHHQQIVNSIRDEILISRSIYQESLQREESLVAASLLEALSRTHPQDGGSRGDVQPRRGVWED